MSTPDRPAATETLLSPDKSVSRQGTAVLRPVHPLTPSVHALLKHLEQAGFSAAPRLVGSGIHTDGRAVPAFVEGEFIDPYSWSDEAVVAVGRLLRRLHDATSSFVPPADAVSPPPSAMAFSIASWRWPYATRAAAWMLKHRSILEHALA